MAYEHDPYNWDHIKGTDCLGGFFDIKVNIFSDIKLYPT